MRFSKVEEILEWVSTYHQILSDKYMTLADNAPRERSALLLRYLSDHQKILADAVGRYASESANQLLASWTDESPNLDIPDSIIELQDTLAAKDIDEIVETAVEFQKQLVDMYTALQAQATNPSTQALFATLARMEKEEEKRTVRDAGRLEGY